MKYSIINPPDTVFLEILKIWPKDSQNSEMNNVRKYKRLLIKMGKKRMEDKKMGNILHTSLNLEGWIHKSL